ncbi:hypothetical protein [Candidatus Electronema sp. JM]|uniref:hypothetical protein n=1 Tax=Candidatus Electronema sp. JM TaxID=3401571 RepID=UPI003AA7C0EF
MNRAILSLQIIIINKLRPMRQVCFIAAAVSPQRKTAFVREEERKTNAYLTELVYL